MNPMVMVALDHDQFCLAELLARTGHNIGFKLNLDLVLDLGIRNSSRFKDFGRPVFVDLKMWNGQRTMTKIIGQLCEYGFDYTNVHILAGPEIKREFNDSIKLLGVALLTHYDMYYGQTYFGQPTDWQVTKLVNIGNDLPLDGIICHPAWARRVIKMSVCPGIRPLWYKDNRHRDSVTPAQAVASGVDILVIGSPITNHESPLEALDLIFEEIRKVGE